MKPALASALAGVFTVLVGPVLLHAQPTGTISGTVRDGYGAPVSAAEVLLKDSPRVTTRSDDEGRYTLRGVPAGLVQVTARRLGYVAVSRAIRIGSSDATVADWLLVPAATQMRPVAVTARRQPSDARLDGFRRRLEAKRSGYFITREMIEQSPTRSLLNALRRVPGARIGPSTISGTSVSFRGQDCAPVVFIDGYAATAATFDFSSLDLNMVEGVEVYMSSSSMPSEFFASRGLERCGVVALWSRPAQPRAPKASASALTSHEEITAVLARAGAYMSDNVEQVASLLGSNAEVTYPDALWRAGVSGEATLEFVVNSGGRIDWSTLSVISATHADFAEAVKVALVNSRWEPALKNGEKVAQIVQLPVHFARVADSSASAAVPPSP